MQKTSVTEIIERYPLLCLDAYGVLVTSSGALDGAREFIRKLNARAHPYFVLTNDASRTPESAAHFYQACGLDIDASRVLTAGLTIEPALRDLKRPRCFVFGTNDTRSHVERGGGLALEFDPALDCDVVVVGDDGGFDFFTAASAVISSLHRQINEGRKVQLLLANSDLLYPRGPGPRGPGPRGHGQLGFTSGAIAKVLELALEQLHPEGGWSPFEILGKPGPRLFAMALERAQLTKRDAVMIGDQLHTDIKGANAFGIDSCLAGSGLTKLPLGAHIPRDQHPTLILPTLD